MVGKGVVVVFVGVVDDVFLIGFGLLYCVLFDIGWEFCIVVFV